VTAAEVINVFCHALAEWAAQSAELIPHVSVCVSPGSCPLLSEVCVGLLAALGRAVHSHQDYQWEVALFPITGQTGSMIPLTSADRTGNLCLVVLWQEFG